MLSEMTSKTILSIIVLAHLSICLLFSFVAFPILEEKFELDITQDEYDDLAWSMAQGKGFRSYHGEESVIRGPGYPAMLAAVYVIAGHNFAAVQLVQCLLSAAIVFLTFLIGIQLFNKNTALLGAAFMALNPLLIWYVPRIMVEVPFTFICLLVFYFSHKLFADKVKWIDVVLTGLFIAVAALIKSIALIFPLVILIALLILRKNFLDSLKYSAVVLVIVVLLISPWSIRNYDLTGEFVPVHTSLALPIIQGKLYVDNFFESPLSTRQAMLKTKETMAEFTGKAGGRVITYPLQGLKEELEVDKFAKKYIVKFYMENPLELAKGVFIRGILFWYYSSNKLFSAFLLLMNSILLALSIIGLWKVKEAKGRWVPIIWTLFFVGFHSLIIASARFTLQLHSFMFLLAAIVILSFFDKGMKEEVVGN